jgi:hypothetical protein
MSDENLIKPLFSLPSNLRTLARIFYAAAKKDKMKKEKEASIC